jgi:regulator of nucleoside diphosphate kinase
MVKEETIWVTKTDLERLGHLIERVRNQEERQLYQYINKLEDKLEYAEAAPSEEIPSNVITMRSRVKLKDLDNGEETVYSLVFPDEAKSEEGKLSILSPLATAILGYRLGDTVEFEAPARLRRLKVLEILYQPEAAGDYNL